MRDLSKLVSSPQGLIEELRQLIGDTRQQAVVLVNVSLTALYWEMGSRIARELLRGDRASYGEALIGEVARHLTMEYGRGFTKKNLWRMVQFAEGFPDRRLSRHCRDN